MNIKVKLTHAENCAHYGVASGSVIMVDLENEYLPCCLASEIYESSTRTPMDAKKAQAVGARTYAASFALAGTVITDTSSNQNFRCKDPATIPNCVKACQETTGQVLLCGGKVITAWYSKSNGGRTDRSDKNKNDPNASGWKQFYAWTTAQDDPWDVAGRAKWGECSAGHGVGMSQIGAAYAAFAGKDYKVILSFYYPNTVIVEGYGQGGTTSAESTSKEEGGDTGMLDKAKLIASFYEIIGWPYVTPGTNNKNGIDCSGAFVRAYNLQKADIYHGSNRIIRVHCRDVFKVTSASQLQPGMAVFKWRNDENEPTEYKKGGAYYRADLLGNFYHIGLVCSVNPLSIVHASSPNAKKDTTIQGVSGTPWSWAGYLNAVDYGTESVAADDVLYRAKVTGCKIGLNFRTEPSLEAPSMRLLSNGTVVDVLKEGIDGFSYIRQGGTEGYSTASYLTRV